MQQPILLEAQFDPKLRLYLLSYQLLALISSIIGILFVPFWIPIGWWWSGRYMASLKCLLTEQALIFNKGLLFRTEKTIPLDKVQDFSLRTGPLLRAFGLVTLRVETAGQSTPGQSEADLRGLLDAEGFRNAVLAQRDRVSGRDQPAHEPASGDESTIQLLREMRDSLLRIEQQLAQSTKDR